MPVYSPMMICRLALCRSEQILARRFGGFLFSQSLQIRGLTSDWLGERLLCGEEERLIFLSALTRPTM
jgi:hypothetical protein